MKNVFLRNQRNSILGPLALSNFYAHMQPLSSWYLKSSAIWGMRGSSSYELGHLIPLWVFSRLGVLVYICKCERLSLNSIAPLEDHPLAHGCELSALVGWILEMWNSAFLRILFTEEQGMCLRWSIQKLKNLKEIGSFGESFLRKGLPILGELKT